MTMEEPAQKRIKPTQTIDNIIDSIKTSDKNFEAVLSDEYYQPVPLTQAYVGKIKNMKEFSKVILCLNQQIPLKELSHLKRARKQEVILCPIGYLNSLTQESIQQFIEENVPELRNSFEFFKVIDVPAVQPKLKKQYLECYRNWSCNFHPNKYLDKLFEGEAFSKEELKEHRLHMAMTFEIAKYYLEKTKLAETELSDLENVNAAIVYDPKFKSVVAACFDNRQVHPIQHSAMLAIDNVAKTQNGGVWDVSMSEIHMRGIDVDLHVHLKNIFPSVQFGAKSYISKSDLEKQNMKASECPYLCTGYYIYLLREPCVMCSMGLVHARVNRVFYSFRNESNGALGSRTKLQCVPALNHHFEVFTNFLDDL